MNYCISKEYKYNKKDKSNCAFISNIQRFSVHDGPGIRTIIFFMGCILRCKWCQNPENLKARPQLMFNRQECISCGECVKVCPEHAIYFNEKGEIQTDREKCKTCGNCAEVCYPEARKICGRSYTVDEVFKEILKDKIFYKNTSGGVTLSGGECTLFTEFVCELLEKCQQGSIHTTVETCGYTKWENIEKIAKFTDLFLYDIKVINPDKHRKWTGVDNSIILDNVYKLAKIGKNIIIRVPLIPSINDDEKEFRKIAEFVNSINGVNILHILPFNQFGKSKYKSLDMKYSLNELKEQNEEAISRCKYIGKQYNLFINIGGSGFVSEIPRNQKK